MLSDIDDFVAACVQNAGSFARISPTGFGPAFEAGDLYCPGCGGLRRLRIIPMSPVRSVAEFPGLNVAGASTESIARQLAPGVLLGVCLQDHTTFTFLIFAGPSGFELATFPAKPGGLATPRTPNGVAYYLDQAQRSASVGANSAAVAMYRAALEHLLFEQGFTARMLGPKIEALKNAIVGGSAPKWARDLDETYLTVLGKLGNAAIHPGDGDIEKQSVLDRQLLVEIEITLAELMHVAYEREDQQRSRLAALQAAAAALDT